MTAGRDVLNNIMQSRDFNYITVINDKFKELIWSSENHCKALTYCSLYKYTYKYLW